MGMTARDKIICCCGAAPWAKVIAWLQIILNFLAILLAIFGLVGITQMKVEKDKIGVIDYGTVISIFVIGLFISILGGIFGLILLKGVNQSRPAYLKAWIMFTALLLVWAVLGAALGRSGVSIWVRIALVLLECFIYGFGIWVVFTLKSEIENKGGVVESVEKY